MTNIEAGIWCKFSPLHCKMLSETTTKNGWDKQRMLIFDQLMLLAPDVYEIICSYPGYKIF